jgi:hypothetical protein
MLFGKDFESEIEVGKEFWVKSQEGYLLTSNGFVEKDKVHRGSKDGLKEEISGYNYWQKWKMLDWIMSKGLVSFKSMTLYTGLLEYKIWSLSLAGKNRFDASL